VHKKVFEKYDKILFQVQFEDQVIYEKQNTRFLMNNINQEECFISILNDSIQQLKIFSNLSIENFNDLSINKFSIQTNRLLVKFINELSFYFWRLIEIIIEFSYSIQKQSSDDCYQLNTIQTLLLSYIDLLNQFHQRRCEFLTQSSSDLIIEFDKKISNELSHMANDILNQLSTISLPNYTTGIIGNT